MNLSVEEIDAWAKENIPEYSEQSYATKSLIRGLIRHARVYGVADVYNLVNLARLYIRTGVEINFSNSLDWGEKALSKDKIDNMNSYTYAGAIWVHPNLSKPINAQLLHELTRAKEDNFGTFTVMNLEGKDDL